MSATDPALILLAAGASRRLGTAKALVRLGSRPQDTPLGLLLTAGAGLRSTPPLVVTGAHDAEIRAALPPTAEAVFNPTWEAGRTGSLQLAIQARSGLDLCLAPVDVPRVPPEVFLALRNGWLEAQAPARGWLAPWTLHQGTRRFGHPVILGRALAKEVLGWDPDRPLRDLRGLADPLLAVEVADDAIHDDLDTPADWRALRKNP